MARHQRSDDLLEQLLREEPKLHAANPKLHTDWVGESASPESRNWMLSHDALRWIYRQVGPESATLETGCGYSTIAFALAGAKHTVISPEPVEHESIKRWCTDHDVPVDRLEFVAADSQSSIHSLDQHPLDLVLIDGDHSFPAPFIDWYYTAERVKRGGLMVVDDTQIESGKILRDFLAAERGRWEVARMFARTAIFRKVTSDTVVRGIWWGQQPYCKAHRIGMRAKLRQRIQRVTDLIRN